MSKVFTPKAWDYVEASPPHPPNTQYKVSIGYEDWGDGQVPEVVKVQMVYDGVVAGRRAPSFPIGSDDLDRVNAAIHRLLTKGRTVTPGPNRPEGVLA